MFNRKGFVITLMLTWPLWVFIIAALGTMAEFAWMGSTMICGDCAFRGSGDGGRF